MQRTDAALFALSLLTSDAYALAFAALSQHPRFCSLYGVGLENAACSSSCARAPAWRGWVRRVRSESNQAVQTSMVAACHRNRYDALPSVERREARAKD
mmetsp:Transcript_11930/g.37756  ORF Transcript_11930/g.37756 Transcript_11930/m.37756 type:complete len:99 (-) Transcript_11930:298-594(-)